MTGNYSVMTLTVAAAGALLASRFVTQAGAYPAAGARAYGVTRTSADVAGDLVPVDIMGTAIVEAGAAVTFDAPLMLDATGRVVPLAGSGKTPVGVAMEAAGAAGAFIEVLLIPAAGLVSA